jgi:phage antirepressor YoqD-like protein
MNAQTTPLFEAARMLNLGPQKLYRELRHRQVLNNQNLPFRRYANQGLFTTELKSYQHPTLGQKLYATAHVTDKGLRWLANEFGVAIQPMPAAPNTQTGSQQ